MTTWFSGLFYLPRLFVYHAMSNDAISINRFIIMEKKLYYYITWPSAVITTICGIGLLHIMPQLLYQPWMHAKLGLVLLLWAYHLACGYFFKLFRSKKNEKSHVFFRIFNEIPVIFLIGIVSLVIFQP